MKILVYCQHVLGVGHLFRTVELVRAMKDHQVTLVLGGPPLQVSLPEHVRLVQLPGLQMDAAFSGLFPVDQARSLEEVKTERAQALFRLVEELRPDVIMVELFPFGRNGFSFELLPLLQANREGKLPFARIVCSLRDILVEKKDQTKFEQRAITRLNTYFDALLIHGDPSVIRLDATFSRMNDIEIPVVYTGYICEQSSPEEGTALRESLRLQPEQKLIVVSAGGGNVGCQLLETSIKAFDKLEIPARMQLFTGPYLQAEQFTSLRQLSVPGVRIERFADNFPVWLSAADLSISMGGYNTTMNVLASGTPGLILPFSQNREQGMRVAHLAALANIGMLDERKLSPGYVADNIALMLQRKKMVPDILLDGALRTNEWLTKWAATGMTS